MLEDAEVLLPLEEEGVDALEPELELLLLLLLLLELALSCLAAAFRNHCDSP